MRFVAFLSAALALPLLACAQDVEQSVPVPNLKPASQVQAPQTNSPQPVQAQANTSVQLASPQRSAAPTLECTGLAVQGGMMFCQTYPNVEVKVGRAAGDFYTETSDAQGRFVVGFDRDETVGFVQVGRKKINFNIAKQDYAISRIDGLPPSQVSSFSDAQLKRIRASSARKKVGFGSRSKEMGFETGFDYPLKTFKKTSPFGAQRILNGEAKKPHYGVDIAAPLGTPIYAPADGVVSLADDDLYFEGAMVLLDHGQGLISMYLHVEDMFVEPGDVVTRGQQIATVGSKGRSTGPHLCWRLKWRNRNLDPELLTKWTERAQTFR